MTSLSSIANLARIRSRITASRSNLILDPTIVLLANEILEECRNKMVEVESSLVVSSGNITTAASMAGYTPSFTHDGFLQDGVWLDGKDWYLRETIEEEKVKYDVDNSTSPPDSYYFGSDGKVYLLPVPDAIYTIHALYWLPLTKLTTISGGGSDLPTAWKDIWDRYVCKRLEYEMRSIYEMDTSRVAVEIAGLEAEAINSVCRHTIRRHRNRSDFFSAEGV